MFTGRDGQGDRSVHHELLVKPSVDFVAHPVLARCFRLRFGRDHLHTNGQGGCNAAVGGRDLQHGVRQKRQIGAHVIGDFDETPVVPHSGVAIEMPGPDLVAHWRRCGLSADFLAGYVAYDFENRTVAMNVLSTVINEVLENAAKFSVDSVSPVRIGVTQHGDRLRIEATNLVQTERARTFEQRLIEVLESDPEDIFLRRVLRAESLPGDPGLGLIVLRKDYAARIAAKVEPREDELSAVTVQVTLRSEEVGTP